MEQNKRKRILVYGMSDNPGGMEAYILYMLRHADLKKHHFDMLTVFPEVAYRDELHAMECKIYYAESFARHPLRHTQKVYKIMKEYDVLYMNILDAGSFGTALAAKFAGKKIVIHSHNSCTERMLLHKVCRPIINKLADERFSCSDIAGKHMFGKRSFSILNNEIERDTFIFNNNERNRMRKLLHIENSYVICHVGRITRQKNPYGVLEVFKGVKERVDKAVLLYIGEGDMRSEVEAYIETNFDQELKDAVKMLGVRTDVAGLLSASDVFILPSLYEGNPISAIEAQENGLPCVIADNIQLRPIGNKTYKININNMEQWVETIIELKDSRRDGVVFYGGL